MERGNTKHGPLRDDELARDTEDMVRAGAQPGRVEEGLEPEPLDDPRELFVADATLTEEEFPLTRQALLAIVDEKGASPALADRVSSLPGRPHYQSTHDLLEALDLAHPEEDAGQGS